MGNGRGLAITGWFYSQMSRPPLNTRTLTATSIFQAFGRSRKGMNNRLEIDGTKIPPFLAAKNLEPYIGQDLIERSKPIKYLDGDRVEEGYDSRILPNLFQSVPYSTKSPD